MKFGRLTVVRMMASITKFGRTLSQCLCRCDCGVERVFLSQNLLNVKSCGCLKREVARSPKKHGEAGKSSRSYISPEYRCWLGIRSRCLSPTNPRYSYYGGRGITICERWESFENFLADMGRKPSPQHSIERKENDGDYTPDNCKWATKSEQALNRRSSVFIEFEGERLRPHEWSKKLGIPLWKIHQRHSLGQPPERILHDGKLDMRKYVRQIA